MRLFDTRWPPANATLICSSASWVTTRDCCRDRLSYSAQNATTGMKGACLWGGNATQWDACVQRTGIIPDLNNPNPEVPVNGTDGQITPGLAECTPYGTFFAERQAGASHNQENITIVYTSEKDKHDPSSAPQDNSVLFSTIDAERDASRTCCNEADEYWRRFAEFTTTSSGACIFHKDEAEKKNIYEEYWKPCIQGLDAYPAQIENVTGTWSAGFANRASAGLVVAAAALALLA